MPEWQKKPAVPLCTAAWCAAEHMTRPPRLLLRFKKGGRGWVNPFRAREAAAAGVRDELKTQEQVRMPLMTCGEPLQAVLLVHAILC